MTEMRVHRAIFGFNGSHGTARSLEDQLWDAVEDYDFNDFVTVEAVNKLDGDDVFDYMFHIVGANNYPEAKWKKLVKAIEKKFKQLKFERLA